MDAIIFDLDGTLVDSLPDIARAANAVLASYDKPELDHETVRSFIGNGLPHFSKLALQQANLPPDLGKEFFDRILAEFEDDPCGLTLPYPGVLDALENLKSQGFPLAVCTNKVEALSLMVIEGVGISSYFDVIVGGDTLSVRKPDPKPLKHTAKLLNASTYIYIGDSEVDEATAMNAAAPFGFFTEGYAHVEIETAVFRFSHFDALPELISRHL